MNRTLRENAGALPSNHLPPNNRGFTFQDEVGGSSPARPTTPGLTWGNASRAVPSITAARVCRLRTAVRERIPATAVLGRIRLERKAARLSFNSFNVV
jgi:hypothetical protein